MKDIHNVKLELLRPGPAHNQLLSPLTPYLALCGADGPTTVYMPFEQRQLLNRLERLRYEIDGTTVSPTQREAEVREMGEAIGKVLGQIPSLLSELSDPRGDGGKLVHLRLSLSAFELGMVPFETAIAPDGFPGSGSPLFLQSRTPIVITREVRRGRPLPVEWNRPPRILFAFASPGDIPEVPAQDHLEALRRAIEPWVKIKDTDEERIAEVKKILTVLPNASLEQIREACSTTPYTHVHILAHGAPLFEAVDRRYGVLLCSDADPDLIDVVDGERLAIVLTARDASGNTKSRPSVVTLATCDSGNINSVLTPGGSIAHELHAAGIPWVFASQFPLWMRASSIAAEIIYSGLLRGDDPRWVLYDLRQRLRTDSPGTHDWASIVCYATVPWNFEQQVEAFRDERIRRRLDVKFDRIDELVGVNADGRKSSAMRNPVRRDEELKDLCASIRTELKAWCAEPITEKLPRTKAERLGMAAASEKRIGIAYFLIANSDTGDDEAAHEKRMEGRKAYESSRDLYREALEVEPYNPWLITQYLSMLATPILADTPETWNSLAKDYGLWWETARLFSEWQLCNATGEQRAYILATLAELSLLGVAYGGQRFRTAQAERDIRKYCEEMLRLLDADAFPVLSTQRQFRRYLDYWARDQWNNLAQIALATLTNNSRSLSTRN
ncbi:CHAT domain-containing protein [Methylocaldum szegediense]|uniref:CHAT domain-containing protein n=1 Tax=Methylocaldum szegediense TaxID=73780 RepID=A0ABN8X0I9_9GAMM|nr:CHAT domain-containing protein [Methylocaldum szegediense]CAI8785950.1 CHAT domain-containing protein [Methylocaldum szegediense]